MLLTMLTSERIRLQMAEAFHSKAYDPSEYFFTFIKELFRTTKIKYFLT